MNEWRMYNYFPALSECHKDGKRLVYLDSAATTQRPGYVISEEANFYKYANANPLRGLYGLSEEATKRYAYARETVADFMNAEPEEVVFTRNATEGLNVVALMLEINESVNDGDNVVVMLDSHHSNLLPWQRLCDRRGAELRIVDEYDDAMALIDDRTRVVALTHVSNVTGKVYDVRPIFDSVDHASVCCVLDMAQSVAHMMPDPRALCADFAVFSGHKIYGPFGIGVLWGRKEVLADMPPVMLGGEMVKSVSELDCCYADAPHRFEAGTPNVAGAVALGTAIDWFSRNYEYIFVHERAVYDYAVNRLSSLGFVDIIGYRDGEHVSCISFNVDGCHPHDVASVLADENICIRAGYLCAQPYLDAINKGPCCRMSIGAHTTMVDVDVLCEGLEKAKRVLSVGD